MNKSVVKLGLLPEDLLNSAREELRLGQPAEACARLDGLIAIEPGNPHALHLKGLIQAWKEAWGPAAACIRFASQALPDRIRWIRDLAMVLAAQGDWTAAADQFLKVIEHSPADEVALGGYGRALMELGHPGDAIEYLRRALGIRESFPVLLALGRSYAAQERFNDAAEVLERAVVLDPARTEPYRALGWIYFHCGELNFAYACWTTVLSLAPGDSESSTALIRTCWGRGDLRRTLELTERCVADGSASEELHAFALYIRMFDDRQTRELARQNCQAFGRRITPPLIREFTACNRSPTRPDRNLRIGYLSGEFVKGPAFYFLSPLIGSHDLGEFDIFLYHTRQTYDGATSWYSRLGNWRDCRGFDDDALRQRIDEDGIDILVDTSGFFPDNRLRVFAGRAAPVQATYPNCPTTTGVSEIDYIFTDRWTCPHGHEAQYVEQPIYLPSGYLAYAPPGDAPPVTGLPALRNGFVTFGLFQRRAKTNARVWDAVAQVLDECRGSRLLLQNYDVSLDDPESENHRLFVRELANRGIAEARLSLRGARPHADTLSCMSEADIALDTFPYQGQTTTCECLWQGVPVVTLSGETHVSRVGSALLQRIRLSQLATNSSEEYIQSATRLAGNLPALARLRAGMRDRLLRSTLLNGRNLARNVEVMYRRLWQAWREGKRQVDLELPVATRAR